MGINNTINISVMMNFSAKQQLPQYEQEITNIATQQTLNKLGSRSFFFQV